MNSSNRRDDLKDDPRYTTPEMRYENRASVDEMLSAWTINFDKREVMKMLGEAGVAAGAVFDTKDLSEDPHLRKRGIFVTVKHPVRGDFTMPGFPVKMSESFVPVTCASMLGAQNDEVYAELLGMSKDQVAKLRDGKVI